jgi:hypothetical protein
MEDAMKLMNVPSPEGAGVGVMDDGGVLAMTVVAEGVEEEGRCSFQKPEELAGSALTISFPLSEDAAADDNEVFEGGRPSQVAALFFGTGLPPASFSPCDFSVVEPSLTVALRVITGFFLSFVGFISAGSSETSCLSRPIIHHEPEDLTLTDSVFLSSISPRNSNQQKTKKGKGEARG